MSSLGFGLVDWWINSPFPKGGKGDFNLNWCFCPFCPFGPFDLRNSPLEQNVPVEASGRGGARAPRMLGERRGVL